jgi:serine/threonine protein kinase
MGKRLFISSEFASNGDLFDYIQASRGLPDALCRQVFRQILDGLNYLHEAGVVHRDMKLENMLFDDLVNVKICDFGMMKVFAGQGASPLTTKCGTAQYKSPELRASTMHEYDGPAVDIFAIGVCLYMMLTAKPPFHNSDDKHYRRLKKNTYRAAAERGIKFDKDAAELIQSMIC